MGLLEVGRIGRAHGVRGDVLVALVTTVEDRLAPGTVLATPRGPMEVERSSFHSGRWIVHFRGVETREAAEALRNTVLSAEAVDDPDELWVHKLIGAAVVDQDGVERGRCAEVHAGSVSDLLVLDSGAVVPVTFVQRQEGDRIFVDVPEGLFDL